LVLPLFIQIAAARFNRFHRLAEQVLEEQPDGRQVAAQRQFFEDQGGLLHFLLASEVQHRPAQLADAAEKGIAWSTFAAFGKASLAIAAFGGSRSGIV
jgi:hypothetical protein